MNTIQKVIVLFVCALPFLFPFYDDLQGINNKEEEMLYIGTWVVSIVAFFLFKDKKEIEED